MAFSPPKQHPSLHHGKGVNWGQAIPNFASFKCLTARIDCNLCSLRGLAFCVLLVVINVYGTPHARGKARCVGEARCVRPFPPTPRALRLFENGRPAPPRELQPPQSSAAQGDSRAARDVTCRLGESPRALPMEKGRVWGACALRPRGGRGGGAAAGWGSAGSGAAVGGAERPFVGGATRPQARLGCQHQPTWRRGGPAPPQVSELPVGSGASAAARPVPSPYGTGEQA